MHLEDKRRHVKNGCFVLETSRDIWKCTDDDDDDGDDDEGKLIRGDRVSVDNIGSLVDKIVQKHQLSA